MTLNLAASAAVWDSAERTRTPADAILYALGADICIPQYNITYY